MTGQKAMLAAALVAAALAVGCSSAATSPSAGPAPQSATPAPVRKANPADVHFMQGMIHHHAQALVMAGWSATHGASESIRTLSQRIIVSQTDEIKLMQQWLREMGEQVPEATPTAMRMNMGGREHEMLMPGMLTEAQMRQLEAARGLEFDRLFLTFMIQHHEGALTMVEDLFAAHGGGVDDFIYKIAADTFADQGSEIDRMQRMLDAMGNDVR